MHRLDCGDGRVVRTDIAREDRPRGCHRRRRCSLAHGSLAVLSLLLGGRIPVGTLVSGSSWSVARPLVSPASVRQTRYETRVARDSSRPWPGLFRRSNATKSKGPEETRKQTPKKEDSKGTRRPVKESLTNATTFSMYERFRRKATDIGAKEPSGKRQNTRKPNAHDTLHRRNTTEVPPSNATSSGTNSHHSADNTTLSSPSNGIILLAPNTGQPPFRYQMARPGPHTSSLTRQQYPQQQSPSGSLLSPQQQPLVFMLELWLLPVLTLVTRYWVLPWLTRWLLTQQSEDSIQPVQHFALERLNDSYVRDLSALQKALQQPPLGVGRWEWMRMQRRRRASGLMTGKRGKDATRINGEHNDSLFQKTVVVVEVNSMEKVMSSSGSDCFDLKALPDIVSFLLQMHRAHVFGTDLADEETPAPLEIVVLVTSPGGSVSTFGLAAAQLQRLAREPNVQLTVCVDKYAASGGYMMASQAHKLLAAPFATIGSVGVIMEGLNFHDLVKRYGIKPLVVKAGESKNPFTRYGEVTNKDMAHEKKNLDRVHYAFKCLIAEGRPVLQNKLDDVSDGSVWLGREALELNLVDEVMTSSEYIQQRIEASDRVLKLHRANPHRNLFRLAPPQSLDLLPHLQSWATALLSGDGASKGLSFLLQVAGVGGMLHHIFRKGSE